MKSIVFKFWTINLLIAVVMYFAYRIAIINIQAEDEGLLATILHILDILVNLGFSLLYLGVILLCSFTIFLNFIKKVRDSYWFSWFSFSGPPILLIAFLLISLMNDLSKDTGGVITRLTVFSLLYIVSTTILFLRFRKAYLKQLQK